MEVINTIDLYERREFTTSKACYNCGVKASNGTCLSEYTLPDGTEVLGCDDCIEEAERVEREANKMPQSRPAKRGGESSTGR